MRALLLKLIIIFGYFDSQKKKKKLIELKTLRLDYSGPWKKVRINKKLGVK